MLATQWFVGWKFWEWINFVVFFGVFGFIIFIVLGFGILLGVSKLSKRFKHFSDRHDNKFGIAFLIIAAFLGFLAAHATTQNEANERMTGVNSVTIVANHTFGDVELSNFRIPDEGDANGSIVTVRDGECSYRFKIKVFEDEIYIQVLDLDNGEGVSIDQDKAVTPTEAVAFVKQYCAS